MKESSIDTLNTIIGIEYSAGMWYRHAASQLRSDSVSLLGFADYFDDEGEDEFKHAKKEIDYMVTRRVPYKCKSMLIEDNRIGKTSHETIMEMLSTVVSFETQLLNYFIELCNDDDQSLVDFAVQFCHVQEKAVIESKQLYTRVKNLDNSSLYVYDQTLRKNL